ncbi:MAG: coproporphyrinogen dehydrogenase HemZ [Eubacterium sp.]|nr:coproporphyrinogen dehydrogenase HemZ [Eubacterium sp.]
MALRFTLQFNRREFEYDVYNLIRAFYPMSEVVIWYAGEERPAGSFDGDFVVTYYDTHVSFSTSVNGPMTSIQFLTGWEDRIRTKNEVKQLVYHILSEQTGHTLPWGDLTGIRPTKIAMKLLEEGHSDEEIRHEMEQTYFTSEGKINLALSVVHREQEILRRMHLKKGYSLYVGIPFCPTICLYCSFGSNPLGRCKDMEEPYFQVLYRELAFISGEMKDFTLDTIYIGGGTPTSVSAERLDELLSVLGRNFDLDHLAEFTVEAGRPDTITDEKLRVLKSYPVSRISINPQTMNQKTLDLIGRKHTTEDVIEKYYIARSMGFDNINMDLIVGLPGEGEPEVAYTLSEIRKLDPDSLTIHSLALKRATRLNLFKDAYEPVSFQNSAAIMDRTAACAAEMGMQPYYLYRYKNMAGNFENVGYARPGKAGIYNVLIMEEQQSILAAGSGASTKFVFDEGRRIERAENVKDLSNYVQRIDEMCQRKKEGIDAYLRH